MKKHFIAIFSIAVLATGTITFFNAMDFSPSSAASFISTDYKDSENTTATWDATSIRLPEIPQAVQILDRDDETDFYATSNGDGKVIVGFTKDNDVDVKIYDSEGNFETDVEINEENAGDNRSLSYLTSGYNGEFFAIWYNGEEGEGHKLGRYSSDGSLLNIVEENTGGLSRVFPLSDGTAYTLQNTGGSCLIRKYDSDYGLDTDFSEGSDSFTCTEGAEDASMNEDEVMVFIRESDNDVEYAIYDAANESLAQDWAQIESYSSNLVLDLRVEVIDSTALVTWSAEPTGGSGPTVTNVFYSFIDFSDLENISVGSTQRPNSGSQSEAANGVNAYVTSPDVTKNDNDEYIITWVSKGSYANNSTAGFDFARIDSTGTGSVTGSIYQTDINTSISIERQSINYAFNLGNNEFGYIFTDYNTSDRYLQVIDSSFNTSINGYPSSRIATTTNLATSEYTSFSITATTSTDENSSVSFRAYDDTIVEDYLIQQATGSSSGEASSVEDETEIIRQTFTPEYNFTPTEYKMYLNTSTLTNGSGGYTFVFYDGETAHETTGSVTTNSVDSDATFEFVIPITDAAELQAGEEYYFQFEGRDNGSGSVGGDFRYSNTDVYEGGNLSKSTDSGSNFTQYSDFDLRFEVGEAQDITNFNQTVTSGNTYTLDSPSESLYIEATLSSSDGESNPTITDLQVTFDPSSGDEEEQASSESSSSFRSIISSIIGTNFNSQYLPEPTNSESEDINSEQEKDLKVENQIEANEDFESILLKASENNYLEIDRMELDSPELIMVKIYLDESVNFRNFDINEIQAEYNDAENYYYAVLSNYDLDINDNTYEINLSAYPFKDVNISNYKIELLDLTDVEDKKKITGKRLWKNLFSQDEKFAYYSTEFIDLSDVTRISNFFIYINREENRIKGPVYRRSLELIQIPLGEFERVENNKLYINFPE